MRVTEGHALPRDTSLEVRSMLPWGHQGHLVSWIPPPPGGPSPQLKHKAPDFSNHSQDPRHLLRTG